MKEQEVRITAIILSAAVVLLGINSIIQTHEISGLKYKVQHREDSWSKQIKFDDAVENEFKAVKAYIDAK